MKRLEGKIALVTGAGAGIGRSVALRFAAEGATVPALSRSSKVDSMGENVEGSTGGLYLIDGGRNAL